VADDELPPVHVRLVHSGAGLLRINPPSFGKPLSSRRLRRDDADVQPRLASQYQIGPSPNQDALAAHAKAKDRPEQRFMVLLTAHRPSFKDAEQGAD